MGDGEVMGLGLARPHWRWRGAAALKRNHGRFATCWNRLDDLSTMRSGVAERPFARRQRNEFVSITRIETTLGEGSGDDVVVSRPEAWAGVPPRKKTLGQRVEAYISRLSTKNNFWHKVCSMIWLPYAFSSGIRMKRLDSKKFRAVLPFKRINRNWYNAMAGAALLGNSEVAAGMYLFSECGGDYTVVCKEMKYRFLRPCMGPAVYEVINAEDVKAKVAAGGEFNISLEMEIRQQLKKRGKEIRVGRCDITFHCTPKSHHRERNERRKRSKTR
jgi:hypothetical protein